MADLTRFVRLSVLGTLLALAVVLVGAWVRLSDAGLGCPDWPGCYGRLLAPASEEAVRAASRRFPERPVEQDKAVREMVHRYLAGGLGLLVLGLGVMAWRRRHRPGQRLGAPAALVALVIVQSLLGMWTVTLQLKPVVVVAHLLGGYATLALLWWLALRHGRFFFGQGSVVAAESAAGLRAWVLVGVAVVVAQAALGAWTSSNYAALACPDFPRCQGDWLPPMDFGEAFRLWRGVGVSYEGGVLDNEARVTIHLAHRVGAVVTILYIAWLAARAVGVRQYPAIGRTAVVVLALVLAQAGLGVANVMLGLPLATAVAHTGVAALILLALVTLYHMLDPPRAVL